jgi:aspartate/methionine/tyrosine aminotransferase
LQAVLGTVQVGYFTPDYTAYEQALGLFLRVSPSPLLHRDVTEACMSPEEFDFQCGGRGCGAILMSNPANPTGQSIEGDDLRRYVQTARDHQTAIIMDEFYSYVISLVLACATEAGCLPGTHEDFLFENAIQSLLL